MKSIIDFIVNNRQTIILIAACLLDLVLFLVGVFRKKKVAPLDDVLVALPSAISLVEGKIGAGNGELKKKYVLDMAKALYKESTGVELSDECKTMKLISKFVEAILETPTKKGN